MFSEFKSYKAFFMVCVMQPSLRCDVKDPYVWYLGSLGVIPRIYLFFFNFTIHGSLFIAQEQPPKPWLFSFVSSPNYTKGEIVHSIPH